MWAVFAMAAWAGRDADGDGVRDRDDRCPDEAEDIDGWQDADGCPDPPVVVRVDVVDSAGAPLADAAIVARSRERATAARGGLLFSMDPGPLDVQAEAAGFQTRTDRLSIGDTPDPHVRLVLSRVDRTGGLRVSVRDTAGLPVPGATVQIDGGAPVGALEPYEQTLPMGPHLLVVRAPGSGGARALVGVPLGETREQVVVLQRPRVIVTRERIDLQESIFFETNKSTIEARSDALLDELALAVADHPEIARLRVEGHTDSRGTEAANFQLSQARAAAVVEALVQRGIERARLASTGYGESRPLQAGDTEEAWARNRRVDLIVEPASD
jgi:outer membrane protein OmpA-like peptidoglycan-associated protein